MKVHSYFSETGRDLIMEYIDSLTEDERIDALSVLECIEKDEFEEIFFKRWEKKIFIYCMRVENRKTRQKKG